MARGDYGPEVRAAMGGGARPRPNMAPRVNTMPRASDADEARDAARGIKEGSPQDQALDAMPGNQQRTGPRPPGAGGGGPPSALANLPLPGDLHHIAAATSIAHAILGNRGRGPM